MDAKSCHCPSRNGIDIRRRCGRCARRVGRRAEGPADHRYCARFSASATDLDSTTAGRRGRTSPRRAPSPPPQSEISGNHRRWEQRLGGQFPKLLPSPVPGPRRTLGDGRMPTLSRAPATAAAAAAPLSVPSKAVLRYLTLPFHPDCRSGRVVGASHVDCQTSCSSFAPTPSPPFFLPPPPPPPQPPYSFSIRHLSTYTYTHILRRL